MARVIGYTLGRSMPSRVIGYTHHMVHHGPFGPCESPKVFSLNHFLLSMIFYSRMKGLKVFVPFIFIASIIFYYPMIFYDR
jgi:hypothetical protein